MLESIHAQLVWFNIVTLSLTTRSSYGGQGHWHKAKPTTMVGNFGWKVKSKDWNICIFLSSVFSVSQLGVIDRVSDWLSRLQVWLLYISLSGQIVHTCVPLLPNSQIWYQPMGSDAHQLKCDIELHGVGILRGWKHVTGLCQGWNEIMWDSYGNVALFDYYGASAATKICFQTVAGCSLWSCSCELQCQLTDRCWSCSCELQYQLTDCCWSCYCELQYQLTDCCWSCSCELQYQLTDCCWSCSCELQCQLTDCC